MKSIQDSATERNLEEFIQDLVWNEDRPKEIDLLLEILLEIKRVRREASRTDVARPDVVRRNVARIDRSPAGEDRYDIFKMYPDRIVRVGFVKGADNAKRVLPSLNSIGDSMYFLHDSGAG